VIDEDAMLEAATHPKPIPGVKFKDVYYGCSTRPKRRCTQISPVASP
jgi:hypothetical protein